MTRSYTRWRYYPQDGIVAIDPNKLRYWRDVRMFTRAEVAEDCKVAERTVKSWELGTRNPEAAHFRKLIRALGIEPEALMLEGCRYRSAPDPEEEDHG